MTCNEELRAPLGNGALFCTLIIYVPSQPLNTEDFRKGKSTVHIRNDPLCEAINPQNGNAYQLYTLYRDKEGVIRQVTRSFSLVCVPRVSKGLTDFFLLPSQAPASGCHCKPLIRKLEGQVKATQEEMRLHILNMQEQVDSRLGKMDRRNRHQVNTLAPNTALHFCYLEEIHIKLTSKSLKCISWDYL